MAKYRVEDNRNIALVGHAAAGKTTLADTLLFQAKAVDRRGSVEDGTSVSDYDDEEKKRHISIDTSVLHLEFKGKRVNILDTPGYPDFVGAAQPHSGYLRQRLRPLQCSPRTRRRVYRRRQRAQPARQGAGRRAG